jgi:predicted dehydrogenase
MSDHVRVLLVGAGRAGLVHGRNFAAGVPGAVLQGVADPSQDALAAAGAELDCGWTDPDPLDAVTRDDVDAVVIATPTFSHAELAVTALEAGKHVLLEKPLASTMEEAHRISAAAERADGILMMAFMRRFDPGFARVAERIAAGDIGQPLLVRSTGRGPGLPPEWAWDTGRAAAWSRRSTPMTSTRSGGCRDRSRRACSRWAVQGSGLTSPSAIPGSWTS